MKIVTLAAAFAAGIATAAHACDDDTIESNSDGVLVMLSGNVYKAHFESDVSTWLP
jgi:hypothetical protein